MAASRSGPCTKWTGARWVLATLADLGYPPGDDELLPLRDQVLEWLLDERRVSRRRAADDVYLAPILTIAGRARIHASLEGNAPYSILALGLGDVGVTPWLRGWWSCSGSTAGGTATATPLRRIRRSRRRAAECGTRTIYAGRPTPRVCRAPQGARRRVRGGRSVARAARGCLQQRPWCIIASCVRWRHLP
jgi:hypothetical protein